MDTHIPQQPTVDRLALTVTEFCQAHAISKAFFYMLRGRQRGPKTFKVGRRTLVSVEAAAEYAEAMRLNLNAALTARSTENLAHTA